MYSYIVKTSAIGINLFAALVTLASYPANAQSVADFVDLNQLRQFFDEGKGRIERKIKWLQQDLKLPQIKIPQHSYRSPDLQNSNFFYAEAQLQPISQGALRDNKIGCLSWQIRCDR